MADNYSTPTKSSDTVRRHSMLWGGFCIVTVLGAFLIFEPGNVSISLLFSGMLLGSSLAGAVMALLMLRCGVRMKAFEKHQAMERVQLELSEVTSAYLKDLPVGFFVLGADGVFRYVNTVFARWLGSTSEDLLERKARFVKFMVEPDTPSSGGIGAIALRRDDGTVFNAFVIHRNNDVDNGDDAVRAVVLRDLDGLAGLVSTRDAASLNRQELLAGPSEWLFKNAPIGIALLSEGGTIREINQEFSHYLGVPDDNIVGTELTQFVVPEDREEITAALSKLMMGTARAAHIDVRIPLEGAGECAASFYISAKQDGGDQDVGLVLHVIDVTEHRHLEVQFAQSQKMQAVGQLAGGVAHDFNNLLTAMIGFSDLLLERHGPDDPSFADIMQIRQNANRATNLVRQLLAFSRKQRLEPVVIDSGEVLADLANLLGRLIGEQVDLQFSHASNAYLIRADRGQFDQVIINLAVNARDAMPGGGTLSIRTRNETVLSPVQRGAEIMPPGAYLVIEVADTGTGIARENLDRIFEPFYSTKEVGAGTGLGLSTVYGIVRQSEGFIFVESSLGRGSTFSVFLPAYGTEGEVGAVAAAAAADKALVERRAGLKIAGDDAAAVIDLTGDGVILLVEDEDAVRLFGARALRNKGYTVIEADNGETALDAINNTDQMIDLIVSDVVMPGMDGHTFVQLVRQEMPDMKVILMSGYAEDVFREEISRDPTIHFLAKPFTLKVLAGMVKDVLAV